MNKINKFLMFYSNSKLNNFNTVKSIFNININNDICSLSTLYRYLLKKNIFFVLKKYKKNILIFTKFFYFYFFYSKLYFLNFSYINKNEKKKLISFFKPFYRDWVSDSLAVLTKNSCKLDVNDFLSLKNFSLNYCLRLNYKILFLINLYNSNNDLFFQNNYFFNNFPVFSTNDNTFNLFSLKFNRYSFVSNFIQINSTKPKYNKSIAAPIRNLNILSFKNNFFSLKFSKNSYPFSNIFNDLNLNKFYLFNKFEVLIFFYFKPLFFKYLTLVNNQGNDFLNLKNYLKDYYFYSNKNTFFNNNLIPDFSFFFIIKKKMLKVFNYSKFPTQTSIWCHNVLIRFIEFCTGKKVVVRFNTFLGNTLTFDEKAQCLL
jgi:hypothetical protein